MTHFHFQNDGNLYCEEMNINSMFKSMAVETKDVKINGKTIKLDVPPTPAFVYSEEAIRENVGAYIKAMQQVNIKGKLGYAVKANGNYTLLKTLKESGVQMLVSVSGHEILAGMQAGFSPENIILNGNGKQEWEIKLAIQLGALLNVDSIFDAKQIARITKEIGTQVNKQVKVLLRIRPSMLVHREGSTVHPYVNTAEASKFGFDMKELDQVLAILDEGGIKVFGIHCHLGSCIYDSEVYRCMGTIMKDMTAELSKKGHQIEILDIGGGIGINYHRHISGVQEFMKDDPHFADDGVDPNVLDFIKVIAEIVPKNLTIILEPGRSLIANSGALICKVLGTKKAGEKKFAIIDGSMAEVIRPCLYNAYHQIYPTQLRRDAKWEAYDVVGPICESADFLGHDIFLQEDPSGYLSVMDVGAYCSSMSSNYNMRPRPAEILVSGKTWKCIRMREDLTGNKGDRIE